MSIRVRVLLIGLFFFSAFCISAGRAWAQNLVTNPGFAGDLSAWSVAPDVTFDGTHDNTGAVGSGSAQQSFVASGVSTQLGLSQCISVTAGTTYSIGGSVFIPSGQSVGGAGLVTVSWFSGPDCATGFISFDGAQTSTIDAWTVVNVGSLVAPPGAAHGWITGQNNATGAGTHVVNFDDFFFIPQSPVPTVPASVRWILAFALVSAGALGLRRRLIAR